MAGSKYIPDFLEKYINKDVARQQELSKIMKSDSAILSKTPAPDTTQGDYFMGKNKGYYVPGAPVEKEGLLLPQTGSTISQARLDVISPKITRTEDNQADHEKNIAILDDIQKQGKLTPEDQQFIKDQQAKGVSKYDIAGDLIAKKRYQLGTRQVVIPTIPGKPASLAVNKKNLYSVYDKSEIDNFINAQPPLSPETQEWVKQQKQSGKTSEDIKSELFSQHLQRNLENYIWSKKGMMEKAIDTAGLAISAGANDVVLGTSAFLLDLLSKAPGLGGVKKGKDFLNQLSESNKSSLARNLGINPGDQVGGSDISYEGAKIAGAILSLFVPTGAGSVLKYVGKLPKVEKGLEFLGSFGNTKVVKTFKEASEAISKYLANPNNAKNAARAEWVLKSLKESTIMSGRTSVRSGEVPSAGEFALQTGAFAAGDLAFQGAGKYLGKMLPERLQLTNIVNAGDLQKSSERLARLYGKEADVTDVARWNLDRGIRGTGKQQRQQINNWVEKSIVEKDKALSAVKQTFSDDTIKSLQKALAEKVDIYTDKGIATAGNEEKVAKFRRLIDKEELTMKEVEEARGLLAENLFTKQGTMKEVASKEGWQKVWVDASKWMENKLPGIRAVNKDIEVGIAQAQAIAKKEATNAAKQIASYLGFSGLTGTGVGVYTGDWKKGLAATTLGFGSTQLVKMLRSPLVMSNIAYYLNKLSPQARKVMNALKNGDRIGVDDVLKVVDEIKLLPPPSGKPLSVQNVKGEVVSPTGVMTGKVGDKDIIKASNLGNTKSKYTGETMKTQPQEMPKQEVKKGLLETLSNSKQSQKGKVGEVKSSIPSKKVNNPIIQKLAKKQETPKTPQVDTELASLQKIQESMPGVPSIEVPKDYTPTGGLPTGTEVEAPIISSISKTKGKLPSPDVKRPQIRGFDLSTRSSMLESLKEQGMFTDSFFVVKDKNVSNKLFEYAEKKAIKKGNPTSGTKVDMKALVERAENGADTLLTPKEYMKLGKENGVYLRMDIGNGNQVAVNASYADIFFKNFDDVTFKGNNELSPVVVLSKGEPVGVIMPIKDVYNLKDKIGDFSMQSKTPQVEGKTVDMTKKYTIDEAKNLDIKHDELKGFLKIDGAKDSYTIEAFTNMKGDKGFFVRTREAKTGSGQRMGKTAKTYNGALKIIEDTEGKITKAPSLQDTIDSMYGKKSSLPLSSKSEVKYSKPIEDTIVQEARKYKSAEEFVKAITGKDITVYRGTKEGSEYSGVGGQWHGAGKYYTDSKSEASLYGPSVKEYKVKLNKPFNMAGKEDIISVFGKTEGLSDQKIGNTTFGELSKKRDEIAKSISKDKMDIWDGNTGFKHVDFEYGGKTYSIKNATNNELDIKRLREVFSEKILRDKYDIDSMPVRVNEAIDPNEFSKILKSKGYDSVIVPNSTLPTGYEYLIF